MWFSSHLPPPGKSFWRSLSNPGVIEAQALEMKIVIPSISLQYSLGFLGISFDGRFSCREREKERKRERKSERARERSTQTHKQAFSSLSLARALPLTHAPTPPLSRSLSFTHTHTPCTGLIGMGIGRECLRGAASVCTAERKCRTAWSAGTDIHTYVRQYN
jgi:hypothetical protein